MNRYDHGGGIHRLAAELGRPLTELLDFSASINPLGMPPSARTAAIVALDAAAHYPESNAESLIQALALHHGLDSRQLLAGNGSTPLFHLFARTLRPRRALLVRPAFSEYERSFAHSEIQLDTLELTPQQNFRLDPAELLHRVTPQTELVLLANPGNPSGAPVPPETILTIAHALREQAILAVDEAFIDFCPELSVIRQVAKFQNLYVFRSLTKFYAIPGLRAGYLAGPLAGIDRLTAASEPWALATPTIAAACACLNAEAYREQSLRELPGLRAQLADGLRSLGLEVWPAVANYLLARLPDGDADTLAQRLRPAGILIRPCGNFPPLDQRFLRLAVRTAEENTRLLAALKQILV